MNDYDAPLGEETMELKQFLERDCDVIPPNELRQEKITNYLAATALGFLILLPIFCMLLFMYFGHMQYPELIPWF